ncbi:MAG: hypothetical protein K1X79_03555 [Oligoflexia bacterium]|nr:hypothetical protein [Oligoflexia bacterium]
MTFKRDSGAVAGLGGNLPGSGFILQSTLHIILALFAFGLCHADVLVTTGSEIRLLNSDGSGARRLLAEPLMAYFTIRLLKKYILLGRLGPLNVQTVMVLELQRFSRVLVQPLWM